MQAQVIIQQLGITPSRFATIATSLFDEAEKVEFSQEEVEQIEGVVKFIRLHNERSVKKAVEAYKQGIAAENRIDPRAKSPVAVAAANQNRSAGLAQTTQDAAHVAKAIAERRVASILELANELTADYLLNGIPLDVISQDSLDRLEDSTDKVWAATLGKLDSAGNYLPALVQELGGKKLLSAAID